MASLQPGTAPLFACLLEDAISNGNRGPFLFNTHALPPLGFFFVSYLNSIISIQSLSLSPSLSTLPLHSHFLQPSTTTLTMSGFKAGDSFPEDVVFS
jgi:hypothetical protein